MISCFSFRIRKNMTTKEIPEKDIESIFNYYVKGTTDEKPKIDLSQTYYIIFYEVGKTILKEKISVAKRYIGKDIYAFFKLRCLLDVEVELALLILCPAYMKKLEHKIKCFLSLMERHHISFYDQPLEKFKEREDYIKKFYSILPQRFRKECTASDLIMNDKSIQLDYKQSLNTPFVIDKDYKQKQYTVNPLSDVLDTLKKLTSPFGSELVTSKDISCVVAGGAVVNCLFKELSSPNSDIDIFILGNPELKRKKIEAISSSLMKDGYKMFVLRHILTFEAEGKTPIQIINTNYSDVMQVIYGFDMSYVQLFYNGKDIYGSEYFYQYIPHLETKICRYKTFPSRVFKCLKKGFMPVTENVIKVNGIDVNHLTMITLDDEKVLLTKPDILHFDVKHTVIREEIDKVPRNLEEKNLSNDAYVEFGIVSFYDLFTGTYEKCWVECCNVDIDENLGIIFTTKMFLSKREELFSIASRARNNDIFNSIKYADPFFCYRYLKYVKDTKDETLERFGEDLENVKLFKKQYKIYQNYIGLNIPETFSESFEVSMREFFNIKAEEGGLVYGNKKQYTFIDKKDKVITVVNGVETFPFSTSLRDPLVYIDPNGMYSVYGFTFPSLY